MWPLFAGAATAAAGEALGAAAGRFKADGTGVDLHALERGERGGAPRSGPAGVPGQGWG